MVLHIKPHIFDRHIFETANGEGKCPKLCNGNITDKHITDAVKLQAQIETDFLDLPTIR